MSQKKILLITYYFPPLGGAGIGRPLALFQNLPLHDYECHVLTVKPVLYRAYEPELLRELDNSKIFRAGSRDPSRLLYIFGVRNISTKTADYSQIVSKGFFPDSKGGWIQPGIRMGKKLVKRHNYDLIVSTSPPISAHVVAKELSQEYGIPWVADFRDFWTSYKAERYFFNSDAKRQKAKQLLNDIKSSAKSIVAVNDSVAKYVGADSVITNCYDSQLAKLWKKPRTKDIFTIGVFGTISELTPIYPLIEVLKSVKQNEPEIYSRIRVLQVGQTNEEFHKDELKKIGLNEIFDFRGFQPRAKAIEILSEAALFYLGVSDLGFGLTTSRIFTLLSSGRPILAYTESGSEFDRIMSNSANSFLFNDFKIEEARKVLSKTVEKYLNGDLSIDVEPASIREFSSERMVEKFATLFKQALNDE